MKDSENVVKFRVLFSRLKGFGKSIEALRVVSLRNQEVKKVAAALSWQVYLLRLSEEFGDEKFAAPVDPDFIAEFREYEKEFEPWIGDAWIWGEPVFQPRSLHGKADLFWDECDKKAEESAQAISYFVDFTREQVKQPDRWDDTQQETFDDWLMQWNVFETYGLDFRSVFRRYRLIPFILIPRHVEQRDTDSLQGLRNYLSNAQRAFVFGSDLAAFSLIRTLLEIILREFYFSKGNDLKEKIDAAEKLPGSVNRIALHRIRQGGNDIIHANMRSSSKIRKSLSDIKKLELEFISALKV